MNWYLKGLWKPRPTLGRNYVGFLTSHGRYSRRNCPQLGDDGRLAISSATDGARLWNLEDNAEIGNGFPSDGLVTAVGTDGGPALFTGSGDRLLIWQLETDRWPALACIAAGRNLTADEWSSNALPDRPYEATCPQWEALDGRAGQ